MTETQHTPEPWYDNRHAIWSTVGGSPLAQTTSTKDSARIVACVNALAGLNPEAIADVVHALEMITDPDGPGYAKCERFARAALAKLQGDA